MSAPTDLLVVGGGVAGLTAARRAQQLGLAVTLVEKGPGDVGAGNMVLSGGWFHAAYRSPLCDPAELYAAIVAATDGQTRPELARAWAGTVGRAFTFLRDEGAPFSPLRRFEQAETFVLEPVTYGTAVGRPFHGSGPHRLARWLGQRFTDAGGVRRAATRAVDLVRAGGRVTGAVLEGPDGARRTVPARSVLLADGGFQANPDLVRRYITGAYQLRGGSGDTGDGLVMGLAAGGVPVQMRGFYGHCLFAAARADDRLWPEPEPSALLGAGVVVGPDGTRFVDEGGGNHHVAAALAAHPEPDGGWLVFDDEAWDREGRAGLLPPNPTLTAHGAEVVSAADVAELAHRTGVHGPGLTFSIGQLDRSARGEPVVPTRTGAVRPLRGRLRAVRVVAGITFTLGGLLVDERARVLDGDERPIPGLLAAGGTMGGLNGGPRSGYAGGWSEAATFGLLAAETAGLR